MYAKKELLIRIVRVFMLTVICVQVVFGIIWLRENLGNEPIEKLSLDYITAANNLKVDEYMGILYAVFLKFVMVITGGTVVWLYVTRLIQLFAVAFSVMSLPFRRVKDRLIATGLVVSNPMVLMTAYRILPKAFAFAGVVALSGLVIGFVKKPNLRQVVIIVFLQAMLSCMHPDFSVLLPVVLLPILIAKYKKLGAAGKGAIACVVLVTVLCITINILSTESMSYHRASRTMGILALQRFGWPEMDHLESNISELHGMGMGAEVISAGNCSDMIFEDLGYKFELAKGKRVTGEYFMYEAKHNFTKWKRDRVYGILEDYAYNFMPFVFVPFTLLTHVNGTRIPWLINCFTTTNPFVFNVFFLFSLSAVAVLVVAFVVWFVYSSEKKKLLRLVGFASAIAGITALYNVFIAFRGFDPCNCLFAFLCIPVILAGTMEK